MDIRASQCQGTLPFCSYLLLKQTFIDIFQIKTIDDQEEEPEEERKGAIPPIENDLPQLAALTKRPPSELLVFHVVNVLYGYCFTMRLYNGDPEDDALEALSVLFDLCEALNSSKPNLGSIDAAINSALICAANVIYILYLFFRLYP